MSTGRRFLGLVALFLGLFALPVLAGGDREKWGRLMEDGDAEALVADAREDGAVADLVGWLVPQLKADEESGTQRYLTALDALLLIGPEAQAAIDGLAAGFAQEDPEIRKKSAQVLGKIGPAAKAKVPELLKLAKDEILDARMGALEALAGIGPEAAAAVPLLLESLADATLEIRGRAAEALGLIGKEPAKAVPALTKMLQKDEEKGARYTAAVALGRFGAAAKEAVPVLTKKLESNPLDLKSPGEDNEVRAQCAKTLGLIGPEAKTAVKALLKPFQADPMKGELEDLDVQKNAAEALGRLGAATPEVVPGLIKALQNPLGIGYHEAVCKALGAMGPAAKSAAEALRGVQANEVMDEATRAAATEALKRVGG